MLDNGFRHLPIVDGERAIGIISIRAVLRAATPRSNRRPVRCGASVAALNAPRAHALDEAHLRSLQTGSKRRSSTSRASNSPLHASSGSRARTTSRCSTSPRACSSRGELRRGRLAPRHLADRRDGRERGRRLRRDRRLLDAGRLAQQLEGEREAVRLDVPTIVEGDVSRSSRPVRSREERRRLLLRRRHSYEQQLDGLRMIEPACRPCPADRRRHGLGAGRAGDARLPGAAAEGAPARLDPGQGQRLPALVGGREGIRVGVGRRFAEPARARRSRAAASGRPLHPGVLADDRRGVAVRVEPIDVHAGPPIMKSTWTVESFAPTSDNSSADMVSASSTASCSDWPNAMCDVAFSSNNVLRNVMPVRPTRESPSTSATSPRRSTRRRSRSAGG